MRRLLGVSFNPKASQEAALPPSSDVVAAASGTEGTEVTASRSDTPIRLRATPPEHLQPSPEVSSEPNQDMGENVTLVKDDNISDVIVICDSCRGYGPKWLGWQAGFQQNLCSGKRCGARAQKHVCLAFHASPLPTF